ncbi:MAG: ferritin [Candidatus Krumholzibacteriia bacterium]
MLSPKLQDALNDQINAEIHSGYIYLSMAAWFESRNLDGCARWMRLQSQEENMHGMKIFDYLGSRGARVKLKAVAAPDHDWPTPLACFEAALAHEKSMTERIDRLAELAQTEKDHATDNLMRWYVNEQVEEEASVDDICQKLRLVGEDGMGLFMIDRELKQRQPGDEAAGV